MILFFWNSRDLTIVTSLVKSHLISIMNCSSSWATYYPDLVNTMLAEVELYHLFKFTWYFMMRLSLPVKLLSRLPAPRGLSAVRIWWFMWCFQRFSLSRICISSTWGTFCQIDHSPSWSEYTKMYHLPQEHH